MGQTINASIVNFTDKDIVCTTISGFDSYDWKGGSPRYFDGLRIGRGQSVTCNVNMNPFASGCPFNLAIMYSDLSVDNMRIICAGGHLEFFRSDKHKIMFLEGKNNTRTNEGSYNYIITNK
jgi:hypothetical protein